MKKFLIASLLVVTTGCMAYMTPEGTYIQPLVDFVVVGPPVVVSPPPAVVYRPLPPVVVVPDRNVYTYRGTYYYYYGNSWYWGRQRKGPWHNLPRQYWPRELKRQDDHGRGDHDNRGRGWGRGGELDRR